MFSCCANRGTRQEEFVTAPVFDVQTELIECDRVLDLPEWLDDPDRIAAFRASVRNAISGRPPFDSPTLRRMPDGSFEPIDGIHRTRALRLEGVTHYPAQVIECDDRTATMLRAKASIDKPARITQARAVAATRKTFVDDMSALLATATLYERVMQEDRTVVVVPCARPLPTEPLDALIALVEHLRAVEVHQVGQDMAFMEEVREWLDTMSAWFGHDSAWLISDVLSFGVLGIVGYDDSRSLWQMLMDIPDPEVRHLVLRYLPRDHFLGSRIYAVLYWLGVIPFPIRRTQVPGIITRGVVHDDIYIDFPDGLIEPQRLTRSEIIRLLKRHSLVDLSMQLSQAEAIASAEKLRARRQAEHPEWYQPLPSGEVDPGLADMLSHVVFDVGGPAFVGAKTEPETKEGRIRLAQRRGALIAAIHSLMADVEAYESAIDHIPDRGIDAELARLAKWLSGRLKRGDGKYE
jgi:hypothetical protein